MTQILIEQTRGAKRTNPFPEVWFPPPVVDIQIQIGDGKLFQKKDKLVQG